MHAVKTIECLRISVLVFERLTCKIIFIVARALPNTDMGSNNHADSRFYRGWWACYSSGRPLESGAEPRGIRPLLLRHFEHAAGGNFIRPIQKDVAPATGPPGPLEAEPDEFIRAKDRVRHIPSTDPTDLNPADLK
jgi:hypothetical protein